MKKFTKIIGVLLSVTLLSGCYPSEPIGNKAIMPQKSGLDSNQNIDENNSVYLQTESLIVDMELPLDIPSEVARLKLTYKKWDKARMTEILLDGKEIEEQEERGCTFFPNEKFYSYETKDQFFIYFEPGRFCIEDKELNRGEFKYGSVYTYAYNDFMSSDEELSAFSREDAVTRVNEFLDKLGIVNYGTPRISPITADFANTVLSSFKGRDNKLGQPFEYTPWTVDDEIYFLRYPLIYGTAVLSDEPHSIPQKDWFIDGSYIDAAVSKDKIIKIWGSGIFSEEYETADKVSINYNSNQAVEKLKDFYSNLILDAPANYYQCKMVYLPYDVTADFMTVSCTPAWEFYGYTDNEKFPYKYQCKECFYADTGIRYFEN